MTRALVSGVIFKAPVEKTSKAGNAYVTATIHGKGDAARWWKGLVFGDDAMAEVLAWRWRPARGRRRVRLPGLQNRCRRGPPKLVDHGRRSSFGQGSSKKAKPSRGQSPALRHQTLGRRALAMAFSLLTFAPPIAPRTWVEKSSGSASLSRLVPAIAQGIAACPFTISAAAP